MFHQGVHLFDLRINPISLRTGWAKIDQLMPNFSEGHFGMPGADSRTLCRRTLLKNEVYCPSFSILLGREELAQPPEIVVHYS